MELTRVGVLAKSLPPSVSTAVLAEALIRKFPIGERPLRMVYRLLPAPNPRLPFV